MQTDAAAGQDRGGGLAANEGPAGQCASRLPARAPTSSRRWKPSRRKSESGTGTRLLTEPTSSIWAIPFTMQVYVNKHEWLARQMDTRPLRYRCLENAFLWLEAPGRVQRLADRFATLNWPAVLDGFATRVNPLLRDELKGYRYYLATHQAKYATDVLFTSRATWR